VEEAPPLEMEGRPRHQTGPYGRWRRPSVDGVELFNLAKVPITRERYRGTKIPNPCVLANHA
jgi:RNA-directed DNA polymerase